MGGKSGKQRCEWMLLSGGQGCGTIETAASPNPVGGNLIISVQKHGKAVSVGTVPDGSYYHSIVNSFYSLISFPTKNKATYLDILFQNKLGDSIWYAQNPNPVPNSSYWTGISWMNVLAGHCEWGATPLHRLPSWCHSTSWFLKSSGFIKVHSSSLHCSHTQAPPWNPSGDFQTLSYSSQCLSTSHPLEEVDYWIRHGVIRILSLVKAWNDCTLNSGDTMDTSRSAPVWRSCPSVLVGKADFW